MNSAAAKSRIGVAQTTDADGKAQGQQDSSARRGHGGYRADIEGLRGVAVVLVVLFHAGVWGMRGGFTGVDVFFVLSGYLITDLLVREVERTGTISFVQFYARRTRRLLPAAVLVLGFTLLAGIFVFPRWSRAATSSPPWPPRCTSATYNSCLTPRSTSPPT